MNVENVVNDLVGYKGLKIVQCNDYFNFSLDSVILPNFIPIKKEYKKIMDLGCGNLPIPLILSTKTKEKIVGIEVQKEIYDLAIETLKINKLEDQIEVKNIDIKNLFEYYKKESFQLIFCNPPYFKKDEKSILNENKVKRMARHEILITLDEIIKVASGLLENKGAFALVHRSQRIGEIIELLKKNKLEPKRIRFVYPKVNEESNLVLIEARKNSNPGCKVLSPLIVHDDKGDYSEEVLKMFER